MNKNHLISFALMVVFCSASTLYGQATVRLCNHLVEANEPIVSLGDVATIENASPKIQGRLAKLELGILPTPGPNKLYQLSKRQIALSLDLAGVNLDAIKVQGPEVVQIAYRRKRRQIKRLEKSIKQWLAKAYRVDADDLQVTIQPRFKLSDDVQQLDSPEFSLNSQPLLPLGMTSVKMVLPQKNRQSTKIQIVPVMVELMREVAVAAHNIPAGATLSADDFHIVKRPFTSTELVPIETGICTHMAIQGEGYFCVLMPDGSKAYTRDGAFSQNMEGQFVRSDGRFLDPLITIPTNAEKIEIANTGEVSFSIGGSHQLAGVIELYRFSNPDGLRRIGGRLFVPTDVSGAAVSGTPGKNGYGEIRQHAIEGPAIEIASVAKLVGKKEIQEANSSTK